MVDTRAGVEPRVAGIEIQLPTTFATLTPCQD